MPSRVCAAGTLITSRLSRALLVALLVLGLSAAISPAFAQKKIEEPDSLAVVLRTDLPPIDRSMLDGFYVVLRTATQQKVLGAIADSERVVYQSPRFRKTGEKAELFLAVPARPSVELWLASPAQWVADPNQSHLLLNLAPQAAKQLDALFRARPKGTMALLIRGEVISVQPIQAAGSEVALRAPCPRKKICEHILRLLQDNVVTSGH
jgi:hypothetical protein